MVWNPLPCTSRCLCCTVGPRAGGKQNRLRANTQLRDVPSLLLLAPPRQSSPWVRVRTGRVGCAGVCLSHSLVCILTGTPAVCPGKGCLSWMVSTGDKLRRGAQGIGHLKALWHDAHQSGGKQSCLFQCILKCTPPPCKENICFAFCSLRHGHLLI